MLFDIRRYSNLEIYLYIYNVAVALKCGGSTSEIKHH
jgi:hypothetical protein